MKLKEWMNLLASALFYFPGLAFKRHATRALANAMAAHEAARIWDRTRTLQKDLAKRRPRYSPGVNLLLRYMEWDCALYWAAREAGRAELAARQLVEEVNWLAFGPMITTSFKLARLRSPHLLKRVQWLLDLMFRVLFTRPFRRRTLPLTEEVAFDVVACPLAKYFKEQGVSELTSSAACSLDYRMADVWGMTLRRTQTIAEGYPRCDFRFRAIAGSHRVAPDIISRRG